MGKHLPRAGPPEGVRLCSNQVSGKGKYGKAIGQAAGPSESLARFGKKISRNTNPATKLQKPSKKKKKNLKGGSYQEVTARCEM